MGKISLVRTTCGIKQALEDALQLIGGLARYVDRNDRVLVKPNLNGLEGITDKDLVEALLQLLLDLDVKSLSMGEATFGDARATDMYFNKTGFFNLARRYGVKLINFNRSEIVEVRVKNPLVLDMLRIAREAYEADKIINLPNMKVHYATGISLALKNLKGILVGDEKRRFHEVGLDKAITDLNNTIKPRLHIVDAISCMERLGPHGGDRVDLGLIMAGGEAVEVDYVGALIMGYAIGEVKHLECFINTNNVDLRKIEIVGEKMEEVRHPFKKVKLENIIPKEFRIHNRNACSSCMNAFLIGCKLLEGAVPGNFNVCMGDLHEEDVLQEGMRIGFGNCCSRIMRFDKIIRGCPPYPYTLRDLMKTIHAQSSDFYK